MVDVGGDRGGERRAQLDDLLVELLAVGRSYGEAGAMAGISERSVRRRMSNAEFATRVSVRRGEYFAALAGRLVDAGAQAVEELTSLLRDDSSQVRLRAAQAILALGSQLRVANELEERLTALESSGVASQRGAGS